MTADLEPSTNSPADLGWTTAPRVDHELTSDHYHVLRCAARGQTPDIKRVRLRMALDECRRWNLVRSSVCRLTPAGVRALEARRASR